MLFTGGLGRWLPHVKETQTSPQRMRKVRLKTETKIYIWPYQFSKIGFPSLVIDFNHFKMCHIFKILSYFAIF